MSSLIVEVAKISSVNPHPNAERLELATVKGWQCVVAKDMYQPGDLVTYIPIDSMIPTELSDKIGVTKYLSKGRVKCARLRGQPSFGVITEPFGVEGEEVSTKLGITKYEPPHKTWMGDSEANHPLFDFYTDMENMRNFPNLFGDGEEIIATEKIHGTNSRIGLIEGVRLAGSKNVQRKMNEDSLYWKPWSIDNVVKMLESIDSKCQIILYGEIYGNVQSLKYGISGVSYRAFDLKIDKEYVSYDHFKSLCDAFKVETCPIIYRGPFSLNKIKEVSGGQSTLEGANHIREGVVVKPVKERYGENGSRIILKYINDDYLLGNFDE